jgi:hypothetical protein
MMPQAADGQSFRRKQVRPVLAAVLCAGALLTMQETAMGALALIESVRIMVPATLVFQVSNISAQTVAIGGNERVSFNQANLDPGRALRISVKADGDSTPAILGPILASSFSWTTSAVQNGIGLNGTLDKTTYTPVFQGNVGAKTGRVDLTWRLAPQGPSVRAGTHQVTLRWKVESVTP